MHNAARTPGGGAARRAATWPLPGATLAGGRYLLVAPAAHAASPGGRFKELCPKAASPAGPHVPFWDTAPKPQARGSLMSNRTGPLRPGGLCPAQASAASFHFADDPSLSGGILVGSAVPSLQSPENHPPLWHLPCSRAGPQPGGRTGEGGVGLGLRCRALPHAGCLPVLMYLVCY